jgi:hypothetical protein
MRRFSSRSSALSPLLLAAALLAGCDDQQNLSGPVASTSTAGSAGAAGTPSGEGAAAGSAGGPAGSGGGVAAGAAGAGASAPVGGGAGSGGSQAGSAGQAGAAGAPDPLAGLAIETDCEADPQGPPGFNVALCNLPLEVTLTHVDDDGWVFWQPWTQLVRVSKEGAAHRLADELWSGAFDPSLPPAIVGGELYHVDQPSSEVRAIDLLTGDQRLVGFGVGVQRVVATQEWLYVQAMDGAEFSSHGPLSRLEREGSFGDPKAISTLRRAPVVVSGNHVYTETDEGVVRVPEDGGEPTLVLARPPADEFGTQVALQWTADGDDLVFVAPIDPAIYWENKIVRRPALGGEETTLLVSSGDPETPGIPVDLQDHGERLVFRTVTSPPAPGIDHSQAPVSVAHARKPSEPTEVTYYLGGRYVVRGDRLWLAGERGGALGPKEGVVGWFDLPSVAPRIP